jgi:putative spermidine/putrescine transport system ATP-binding protein
MSTSVEFRNVSHSYGSFQALRDVTLTVAPREFTTLLGPSGSGKSTLLKLLAGFEEPDTGDLLIGGRSVVATPSHKRGIGMVFQNYALFPHMTVAENIAFPLRVRRAAESEVQRRVADVLAVTRLEALAARFPRELSGGQQQRVALARAVVFDPQVLLMDEPLGALDRHLREQLKFEIKRIQTQFEMTVIFVTHDQDEALVLSDRVAIMRDGKIEQVSSPQELYRQPSNRFVAGFIGESNILECVKQNGSILYRGKPVDADPIAMPDGPCWIMVRPELVEMSTAQCSDSIKGTLREKVFLGEVTRYIIDLQGQEVVAKAQNKGRDEISIGGQVFLSWRPSDAVVLSN